MDISERIRNHSSIAAINSLSTHIESKGRMEQNVPWAELSDPRTAPWDPSHSEDISCQFQSCPISCTHTGRRRRRRKVHHSINDQADLRASGFVRWQFANHAPTLHRPPQLREPRPPLSLPPKLRRKSSAMRTPLHAETIRCLATLHIVPSGAHSRAVVRHPTHDGAINLPSTPRAIRLGDTVNGERPRGAADVALPPVSPFVFAGTGSRRVSIVRPTASDKKGQLWTTTFVKSANDVRELRLTSVLDLVSSNGKDFARSGTCTDGGFTTRDAHTCGWAFHLRIASKGLRKPEL